MSKERPPVGLSLGLEFEAPSDARPSSRQGGRALETPTPLRSSTESSHVIGSAPDLAKPPCMTGPSSRQDGGAPPLTTQRSPVEISLLVRAQPRAVTQHGWLSVGALTTPKPGVASMRPDLLKPDSRLVIQLRPFTASSACACRPRFDAGASCAHDDLSTSSVRKAYERKVACKGLQPSPWSSHAANASPMY